MTGAFEDDTVGGHLFSGPHEDHVPFPQGLHRDVFHLALPHAVGHRRDKGGQVLQGPARTLYGAHLDPMP